MKRVMLMLAAMALALLLASGMAWAVTKVGTNGDDVLRGTNGPDTLLGKGGNDTILGRGAATVSCPVGPATTGCSAVRAGTL